MQYSGVHDEAQRLHEASGSNERDAKPDEFAEFYRREFPRVTRYLLMLGASYHDAQDAAQAAFIDSYPRWEGIKLPQKYILKAACNIFFRGRINAARTVTTADFSEVLLPSSQDRVEAHLETAEILGLLTSLPRLQGAVMAMRYDDIPSSEIAVALGISESTVRVHLHRARRQMRDLMALRARGEALSDEQ